MSGEIASMMKKITDYQKNVKTGKSVRQVASDLTAENPFKGLVEIQEIIDSAGDDKMLAAKVKNREKSINLELYEKRKN